MIAEVCELTEVLGTLGDVTAGAGLVAVEQPDNTSKDNRSTNNSLLTLFPPFLPKIHIKKGTSYSQI
jgi:hypothetical protein